MGTKEDYKDSATYSLVLQRPAALPRRMVNRLAFAGAAAPWGWRRAGVGEGEVAEPIRTEKSRVTSVDRMERDLLSRVTGDGVGQRPQGGQDDPGPPPPPTLTLRTASAAEEPQSRAGAATYSHCRHAPSPSPAANRAAPPTTSSRPPFASHRLMASVVVPGYPMPERRHNLRAGAAGARAQAGHGQTTCASPAGAGPAPPRLPAALVLPTLEQLAGPAAAAGPGEERCGACGLSAQLVRGLSGDLDRARAQVALLTCQNESLRSRLKRAAAAAAAAEPMAPAASSSAHLMDLRCGACRVRPATVVLAPREHLCLCWRCSDACRAGAAAACPVCRAAAGPRPAPADASPR